jgi:hypothetical protein
VGVVFVQAVVVSEDGARADLGARTDAAVAQIGQVVGLGALADLDLLDLDEVADVPPSPMSAPGRNRV